MININMRLFGAFRKFGESVTFSLPSGATVHQLKETLAAALNNADPLLIADSAIANDHEIIGADHIFTQDCRLAILPPVCGG